MSSSMSAIDQIKEPRLLKLDDFQIIDMERFSFQLRILKSLYIHKTKPTLNDKSSAAKHNIVT